MSIIRDYEAEKEFELLKWLGESISKLEKLLDPPGAQQLGLARQPQDERPSTEPKTAGLGHLSEDTQ